MKFWPFRNRDEELNEEIEMHLRMAAQDRVDRGESPQQARSSVNREFGNAALIRDVARELRRWASLERFVRETRYALRGLAKSPGFSIAAGLTLAIGLAATVIIFAVVNAVLLRPLPFPQSDRIVTVSETIPGFGQKPIVSPFDQYILWRGTGVFQKSAALNPVEYTLLGSGTPERVTGFQVTAEFFSIFGVQPALGRDFRAGEDKPGGGSVVILSHQLWARKFQSDPTIIGRTLRFGDELRTVIGVMPAGFEFPRHAEISNVMSWAPEETEYWMPLQMDAKAIEEGNFNYLVIGRLARGISFEQARARLLTVARQYLENGAKSHPEFAALIMQSLPGIRIHPDPLQATMTGGIRSGLLILFGAVGLLLLLIYANLATLFLTRSAGKLREISIRQALGASGGQIFYEKFLESAVFAALGAGCGLLLTIWGTAAIRTLGAGHLPRLSELTLDYRVIALLIFLAVAASTLFSLIPWLLQRRMALRDRDRAATGTRSEKRVRRGLVTAEIALTTVLLVSATLLLESFRQVLHAPVGFDTNNLLTLTLGLRWKKFPEQDQRYAHFERLLDAMRRVPGVESASLTNGVPLRGEAETRVLRTAGSGQQIDIPYVELRLVNPNYLRTMRIPLLEGRWLEPKDREGVAVISGNMARRYWQGRSALGHEFVENDKTYKIVGVVGAVRNASLEVEPTPEEYTPAAARAYNDMAFVIRTRVAPENVVAGVLRAVAQLDPEQPLAHIRTMREIVDSTTFSRRFETWLLLSFALTAVLLSALGVFGVLSMSVTQRTREFGIRMALGATAQSVSKLVFGEAFRLLAFGAATGVLLVIWAARLLRNLLYAVKETDARLYAVAILVLAVAGLAACWLPARRASHADPAIVLREE